AELDVIEHDEPAGVAQVHAQGLGQTTAGVAVRIDQPWQHDLVGGVEVVRGLVALGHQASRADVDDAVTVDHDRAVCNEAALGIHGDEIAVLDHQIDVTHPSSRYWRSGAVGRGRSVVP